MKRVVWLATAVAATAVPGSALAQRSADTGACEQWRHGRCISWHGGGHREAGANGYSIGYSFGPRHSFVEPGALPERIVTRYHLGSNFRYVNENGRVYVVSPRTFRVVRVISIP